MAWKNKPSNFALEVVKNADDHLKKIVGETLQQVVTRSPVMDGEFRASHKVTLASPQNSYEKGFDLSGGSTLAEGLKVASTAKIGGLVYIQTLSPYGTRLENGWSQQAPNGVYALSYQSVVSKYK
ncbi:hypothetical protein LDO52_07490 [Acinetobacter pseudolwoffii]|uniref:hypothetical protein n=1 Tax=Acinetobacter pseudolwoffii TaxID=2053287 RepID=UPI001CE085B4|nr:hypothetical protein [Acinetobacter pseudolwoffii]UBX51214.1 hypothetical protein LDO52_07490 [Acinetobacter pseudolwoffii]